MKLKMLTKRILQNITRMSKFYTPSKPFTFQFVNRMEPINGIRFTQDNRTRGKQSANKSWKSSNQKTRNHRILHFQTLCVLVRSRSRVLSLFLSLVFSLFCIYGTVRVHQSVGNKLWNLFARVDICQRSETKNAV